ncbi:MAG: AsmA-like C-terminal region-containing protein [Pseudomonadota bacterium]
MKRFIISAAVLIASIAGLIAALPYFVSSDAVREQILKQAVQVTGREMSFREAPRVLFNPFLGIEINSVIFEDPFAGPDDPPLLQMDHLRGQLDLFSAIFGRAEIKLFQFIRPKFNFRIYENGDVGWHFPEGQVWDVLEKARDQGTAQEGGEVTEVVELPVVKLGEFEIVDGIIEFEDRSTQSRETITNINARIVWPDTASPLTVSGSSIWRDEAFEFTLASQEALMLFSGGGTVLEFTANSGAFTTSFAGIANTLSDLHLSGDVHFASPSLRRFLNFLGEPVLPGSTLAEFEATGKMSGTFRQIQLNDATISLDGNQGSGVLQIARRKPGKVLINGTLAYDAIDFTPYFSALRQEIAIGKNTIPASDLLQLADMDLRLSATEAKIDEVSLANFAASLSVQDNRSVFNIGNANLFGGVLVGEFGLAENGAVSEFRANAIYSDFDVALVNAALGRSQLNLLGRGKAQIDIQSSGSAAIDLARNLKGQVQFEISDGFLTGIDMGTLRSTVLSAQSGSDTLEPGGQTAFELLEGNVAFNRSSSWIRSMHLHAPDVSAQIAGRSALDLSAIALRLRIGPPVEATDRPDQDDEDFNNDTLVLVGGSVDNPIVTWVPIIGTPSN